MWKGAANPLDSGFRRNDAFKQGFMCSEESAMKIVDIEALMPAAPKRPSWLVAERMASPMSPYPEYAETRSSWQGMVPRTIARVTTDDGIVGIGVGGGGAPSCHIIEHHLKSLLVGRDPRDTELLWDLMFRATLPYGRKGLPIMALSAIDNALWDIKGRAAGVPVYVLLGGKTKGSGTQPPRVSVYASGNRTEAYARLGFTRNKVFMRYGPWDGAEGMRQNEAQVAAARDALGPDRLLMVDAWMGWDVPYAIAMAERLRECDIYWLEEPLLPDDYDGYATLRKRLPWVHIACGEHEYTHFGFHDLIQRGCADILQPDLAWCGGITAARRVAAMAETHGLQVIPHIGGVMSYAFVTAHAVCPMAEFIFGSGDGTEIAPIHPFFAGEPLPESGEVILTEAPGWGVELSPHTAFTRPHPT